MHGMALRTNANVISPTAFQSRKAYFVTAAKEGTFLGDPENRGKPPPNPMTDPAMMEGMMGMMKGNVAMMVPQTLIMGWINAFFSGFVISMSTPPSYASVADGTPTSFCLWRSCAASILDCLLTIAPDGLAQWIHG
jgi:hypothetical protein